MKVGQVQRLYTEHPYGVKRESTVGGNFDNEALPVLLQELTPAALTPWRCENPPKRGTLNSDSNAITDMLVVGDIKTAPELGYRGHADYRYSVCQSCGQRRWVRLTDYQQGKGTACRSCGYPSSNMHQKKLDNLVASGAKRASEIGKPVFKDRDPWYYPHTCSSCGDPIWQQTKDFHRVCKKCGYLTRNTSKGESHPNWKGGRYKHGDGYTVVLVSPDNPYYSMADSKGYMLEHRFIVAAYIGRCLLDSEVVHHINGDKADNRIDNLELLPNNASHLPYIRLQQQVTRLERKIKILEWHIRELEQGNPVPMREESNLSEVRRDYTGGTLDVR